MKDNKILMIINEFPPAAESSVQRPLKFLKYMVKSGWDAYVVTPKTPTRRITDYSLLDDIPRQAHIYKTIGLGIRTPESSRMVQSRFNTTNKYSNPERLFWAMVKVVNDLLMPFDKQIGWVPFAIIKSIKLIKKYEIRNIYITAFPFSAFLVGIALKKIYRERIFWVADYRDAWQFSPQIERLVLPFRQRIIIKTDDYVLKTCDRVVFVTEQIKNRYLQKHSWLSMKSFVITNGYDEDDFADIQPKQFPKFTILYMGKIHSVSRNPIPLLDALAECKLPDFQYVNIGTIGKDMQELIEQKNYSYFVLEGYKPHKEALAYAAGADINVVIINDDPESVGAYTGKLFELLRLGKPILAVGPIHSIIEDMLTQTGLGKFAPLSDLPLIKQRVSELLAIKNASHINSDTIKQFSREYLSHKLMGLYG
jgi:glycosyltransferase involved in cell wall biosynthesis